MNGLTGLQNLGNTCYINSLVQIIAHDDLLMNSLEPSTEEHCNDDNFMDEHALSIDINENGIFLKEFHDVCELIMNNYATISPKRFIYNLQKIIASRPNELANVHVQNDCIELIYFIFDIIHDYQKVNIENTRNKFIFEIFGGETKFKKQYDKFLKEIFNDGYSRLHHNTCFVVEKVIVPRDRGDKIYSATFEHDFVMNLPIHNVKELNLKNLINQYFEEEEIEGFEVEESNSKHETITRREDVLMKKTMIRFPNVLFVSLKRFTATLKKIKKMIKFESHISINQNEYDLYAVIMHTGSIFGGHYYCILKFKDEWYEFNDTIVKKVNLDNISTSYIYAFCYKKCLKEID